MINIFEKYNTILATFIFCSFNILLPKPFIEITDSFPNLTNNKY